MAWALIVAANLAACQPGECDRAQAMVILAQDQGTPLPLPEDRLALRRLFAALRDVAVEEEWMDPRERDYVFVQTELLDYNLGTVRGRRVELMDAPHVWEAGQLPPPSDLSEALAFNRHFEDYLQEQSVIQTDRVALYTAALGETARLYEIYDMARDATAGYYYVSVRRRALLRLRELIGHEALAVGKLPPCVPTWRFPVRR